MKERRVNAVFKCSDDLIEQCKEKMLKLDTMYRLRGRTNVFESDDSRWVGLLVEECACMFFDQEHIKYVWHTPEDPDSKWDFTLWGKWQVEVKANAIRPTPSLTRDAFEIPSYGFADAIKHGYWDLILCGMYSRNDKAVTFFGGALPDVFRKRATHYLTGEMMPARTPHAAKHGTYNLWIQNNLLTPKEWLQEVSPRQGRLFDEDERRTSGGDPGREALGKANAGAPRQAR